ncbi:MAG: DUF3467 domain-containing protein [Duncaniella sp.]|nr:DUF3467 domain-containing protein [Duncaniella sp.]
MANNNNPQNQNQIQIELTPEVARGIYSNLAVISHGPNEVVLDFISLTPNMPKATVQSRIIMTPENAKNLLGALADNIKKYEATFGEIRPKRPIQAQQAQNEIPNPFIMGGNA